MSVNQVLVSGGKIHSVSLVLYFREFGFLICEENRKNFPDDGKRSPIHHLIGGKVESFDSTPLHSAVREFCEETGFGTDKIECMIGFMEICDCFYKDTIVSVIKKLYNRTYVINMDSENSSDAFMSFRDEIISLVNNFMGFSNMLRLLFIDVNLTDIPRMSSLLIDLIKIFPEIRFLRTEKSTSVSDNTKIRESDETIDLCSQIDKMGIA